MSFAIRGFVGLCVACSPWAVAGADEPKPHGPKPVDLVLCLDTSNSMDGLLDSAKLRLWDIVNEFARLKPTPDLRVGLYSYGNDGHDPATGWVKREVSLTTDLDEVYKALNALRTRGGTEYVARVTKAALDEQPWATGPGALKLIFVCGNEPVDQDKQVTLDAIAGLAGKGGVLVNVVYCGRANHPEARGWAAFADRCGGRYVNIDQNKAANLVAVKTEYDAEILKLGDELNKTYVAYGRRGKDGVANQVEQDGNAARAAGGPGVVGAPAAALARAASKASPLYRNGGWDLVDRAKDEKGFDLKSLRDDELPDEMKKLSPEARAAYLKQKADERAALQKKIGELSARRQKKIDAVVAGQPKSGADQALDEAVRGIVRDQARAKGFETPVEKR